MNMVSTFVTSKCRQYRYIVYVYILYCSTLWPTHIRSSPAKRDQDSVGKSAYFYIADLLLFTLPHPCAVVIYVVNSIKLNS